MHTFQGTSIPITILLRETAGAQVSWEGGKQSVGATGKWSFPPLSLFIFLGAKHSTTGEGVSGAGEAPEKDVDLWDEEWHQAT